MYGICVTVVRALSLSAGTVPTIDSVIRTDPRTGQFVRTVHVMPRVVQSRTIAPQIAGVEAPASSTVISPAVRSLVEETARQYDMSPELVDSVIQV